MTGFLNLASLSARHGVTKAMDLSNAWVAGLFRSATEFAAICCIARVNLAK